MLPLITGYRGFIGSALTKQVNAYLGIDSDNPDIIEKEMIHLKKEPVDKIYHLGALSGIENCFQYPNLAFSLNIVSTKDYLELARKKEAHIIFASSMAADDPGSSFYALGKSLCEQLLFLNQEVTSSVVRFSNIYGPGSFNKLSVVATMFRTAIDKGVIYVHVGEQKRDFVYVEDAVEGFMHAPKDRISCVATRVKTSINDLAKLIAELTGADITYEKTIPYGITEPKDPEYAIYQPSFGYTKLEDGLEKTYKYFKAELLK